jgi:hypothetical protein
MLTVVCVGLIVAEVILFRADRHALREAALAEAEAAG